MAEKTTEELVIELGVLNTQIKENKDFYTGLVHQYREARAKAVKLQERRSEINALLVNLKSSEKIAKKEARLNELIKAKEEATKLGIRTVEKKRADNAMPVAAHRSKEESPEIDPLAGELDEPVNLGDLEKELDIF
ncbi:MAG: hypothetical protein LBD41_04965 [Clostridiales Family XIII bacterium]|jgi:hypothetical protein|nr:hypothetical protein [Clostridiales Family XIII bacterium]